jgi:4-oxalocrotonate tautomerase
MPYVTIRTLKKFATPEFKTALIAKVSEAVADVEVEFLGADKEKLLPYVWCIVEEVDSENWGVGGVPVTPEMLKEALGISE